ncbi:phage integrase domain/SAM domain-containing protein [Geoanaerobacter pelophilus]|uniref:Phage integrase domain/SAM domain-containing protein n=1 Tax=Geoanaerobacter pelophilus TaxID=60036 RepID=A0ABQ0MEG8_9BACT|nr:site-specific integrase [Geoanaerobacter pelophilus]GAW65505.1 phage integrase domain/SAM domain-containing protein [Geoanaerobacter pelophilus]
MGRRKIFDKPRVFFTNDACRVDKLSRPSIGILVDEYGVPVYPVIDWLITQRKRRADPNDTGTIQQQAFDLRMFWEFLMHENIDWKDVDDNILLRWRDRMFNGVRVSMGQRTVPYKPCEAVEPIRNETINRRLSNVFRFYLYCNDGGLVPEGTIGHGGKFRITVELGTDGKRVWIGRLPSEGSSPAATPDDADIDKLHDAMDEIFGSETSMRNRLYIDWNRYLGLRGIEAASIKVGMIPPIEEIEKYISDEKPYPMDFSPKRQGVRTKGGRSRRKPLDVDPMLLKDTRDYIDHYRPVIVDRAKRSFGRIYKEPDSIFVGTTGRSLGRPIKTKTMQDAVSKAIIRAGIDMTPHALRRVFAIEVVQNLYLAKFMDLGRKGFSPNQMVGMIDDNSIITYASQQLGHRFTTTTLKHYLDLTKLKLLKMSDAVRLAYLERRKGFAQAAYAHYQSESPGTSLERDAVAGFLLAVNDGLLDALRSGDQGGIFRILQKHIT